MIAALLRFDTNTTESMHGSMHSNIYPTTNMLPKGSITPSLPSISDKGIINISHTESYSKSINNEMNNNKINPADLVQKRVLFVSLVQLYGAYLNGIAAFILQHSIFAFGVKRI